MADVTAALFLPVREFAGRYHRRRHALSDEQWERDQRLPPLPAPWSGDNRWYRRDFLPHQHNQIHVLPHGAEYFSDLIEQLESARERVTIAGWAMTPLMPLARTEPYGSSILAEVLDRVSRWAEVYVLLWSGAPKLFRPETKDVEEARRVLLERAPRVHCALDHRARFSHDHHQKAVTIDGRVAYVGGIDLSTFQGDRWDTDDHQLRFGPNWHDIQMRLHGEAVADVETNFCQRWNAVGESNLSPLRAPAPDPSWHTPAQVVRTVPAGFYPFASEGIFGIRHAVLAAIEQAQSYIYLENQYIWSPEVVEALIRAMNRPHPGPFRIALILPASAYSGKYDNDQHVQQLREADAGRGMFEAYSLWTGGPGAGLTGFRYRAIYVHAKACLVDDQWLSVGSANLNRRGLATDTEMCVQAVAPEVVTALRLKLWAEYLGCAREDLAHRAPHEVLDTMWAEVATEVERCRSAGGEPPRGLIHRYDVSRSVKSRSLQYVQALTLEH